MLTVHQTTKSTVYLGNSTKNGHEMTLHGPLGNPYHNVSVFPGELDGDLIDIARLNFWSRAS